MSRRSHRRPFLAEQLEPRDLLSAVPFGASSQDTGEFMLGDVTVNVVFMESDGSLDADTEQWTPELVAGVKANIEEGLQWWSDTLAIYSDVHTLNFHVDYTHADQPVATKYEPISRHSDDFVLWIEDFFRVADVASDSDFSTDIRNFNHRQRSADDTNWAFTIFVVNAENDDDGKFDTDGSFTRAFAYAGGRFFVMPSNRPPNVVAHEAGHMFWAYDEYTNGESYLSRRGYYATQNTNGVRGNPNPDREPSIMYSTGAPYHNNEISTSAREMIGWRDTDGDGIFDVLDVEHALAGEGTFDPDSRSIRFIGSSSVQTLPNQNTHGTGNDMTINRITAAQYRVDGGDWITVSSYDDYQIQLDFTTAPLPIGTSLVEFRTLDNRLGVSSEIVAVEISPYQNPINAFDVNEDTFVTPIDVLHVITALNEDVELGSQVAGSRYLDVSGDGLLSPRDVLLVIDHINTATRARAEAALARNATSSPAPSLEPSDVEPSREAVAALLAESEPDADAEWWLRDEDESLGPWLAG